jgi:hypothetical protein
VQLRILQQFDGNRAHARGDARRLQGSVHCLLGMGGGPGAAIAVPDLAQWRADSRCPSPASAPSRRGRAARPAYHIASFDRDHDQLSHRHMESSHAARNPVAVAVSPRLAVDRTRNDPGCKSGIMHSICARFKRPAKPA